MPLFTIIFLPPHTHPAASSTLLTLMPLHCSLPPPQTHQACFTTVPLHMLSLCLEHAYRYSLLLQLLHVTSTMGSPHHPF